MLPINNFLPIVIAKQALFVIRTQQPVDRDSDINQFPLCLSQHTQFFFIKADTLLHLLRVRCEYVCLEGYYKQQKEFEWENFIEV